MDPTAFSLALAILVVVLSRSCLGADWSFCFMFAVGTTFAIWAGRQLVRLTSGRGVSIESKRRVRTRTHASTIARMS